MLLLPVGRQRFDLENLPPSMLDAAPKLNRQRTAVLILNRVLDAPRIADKLP
jgi:hypothetical protein